MPEQVFQPGDIYEDCAFHPCLCTKVEGDSIQGISLIDGSQPRTCSLSHCGVRKLSLEEVLLWKKHGPQDMPDGCEIAPYEQWWWPKPIEAINPGSALEHLFESSFRFVRTRFSENLGGGICGWSSSAAEFDDTGNIHSWAKVSYVVRGNKCSAQIHVEAEKEGRMWPIKKISVCIDGQKEPSIFEGEQVRGCGYAG